MNRKVFNFICCVVIIIIFSFTNVYLFKNYSLNTIFILDIIFSSLIFIFFAIYLHFYKKARDNKIKNIYDYMNNILNDDYSLDIRDYNEEELSILKNQIYKITTKLKDQTELAQNEKKNLEIILSDISHQIKTPLTSMYVINDLLMNDQLTKKQKKEILTKNQNQLERIEWLVTSLLKLSRLDNGFVELKKKNVNSKELINKVVEPLKIPIEVKKQKLVLDVQNIDLN